MLFTNIKRSVALVLMQLSVYLKMLVSVTTEKSGKRYVVVLSTKRRRIQFPARCWLPLLQKFGEINEAIDSKQCYNDRLGADWFVSVRATDETVHLRRFYYRFGRKCPYQESRDCIDFNRAEFRELMKTPQLFNILPYVKMIHSERNACCFTPY